MQFVTINFGLNGLFIEKSPREFIEGYIDPLLTEIIATPVYEGGDQTNTAFKALNLPPNHPVDNPITFMTGQDDPDRTRTYLKWLNQTDLYIGALDYESISVLYSAPF
jgi:hypothetical protein